MSETFLHTAPPLSSMGMCVCTIDVCAKVDLAHVIILQYGGVSSVGCVMSSTVIERAAGGKSQTCFQSILLNQPPTALLQPLTESKRQRENKRLGMRIKINELNYISYCLVHIHIHIIRCCRSHKLIKQRMKDCDWSSPDVDHGQARFDPALHVPSYLPMRLRGLPKIIPHVLPGFV